MLHEVVLGIDVGTSSTKGVLVQSDGTMVATAVVAYQPTYTAAGASEQKPETWWNATVSVIHQLKAQRPHDTVCAIGLTGQMHGSVVLDKAGQSIRPALLWNDQRTSTQADDLKTEVGEAQVIAWTGNRVITGFTAPKLLWIRENEPEHYAQIEHILLPKDYVRYRLTGEMATDVHDASGTLLLDVQHRRWSGEMRDQLGLKESVLPDLYECDDVVGHVSQEIAQQLGVPTGIPVMAGAGDQAAAALGMGVLDAHACNVSLGTSGVVFTPTDNFYPENNGVLHQFCYVTKTQWSLMGVTLSAGGAVEWLANLLSFDLNHGFDSHDGAKTSAPLLFLPYLLGERTPHNNPWARGTFVGLHQTHQQTDMMQAAFEGVAFAMKEMVSLVEAMGISPDPVTVTGGGAKSNRWLQALSSVLQKPLAVISDQAGSAYGAAMFAAVGAGWVKTSPEAARQWITHEGETILPTPSKAAGYDQLFAIYTKAYQALVPLYQALAEVRS
jgi:xylulokinase